MRNVLTETRPRDTPVPGTILTRAAGLLEI
jgi:hypothetical protein